MLTRRRLLIGGGLAIFGSAGLAEMTSRRMLFGIGAGPFQSSGPLTAFQLSAASAGGWYWIEDPRAIFYNGVTIFGYERGDNGDVCVRAVPNSTLVAGSEIVLHTAINLEVNAHPADDHDNPSFLIRDSDHRLMTWYSAHSGPNLYQRISVNSLDTDPTLSGGFGSEANLDSQLTGTAYTYPFAIQFTGEAGSPKPIYLYMRDPTNASTTTLRVSKSTDDGATWPAITKVWEQSGRSSYWRAAQTGDNRIDFAITNGSPAYDADVSCYHFYYQGGAYYKSDDTLIGTGVPHSSSVTTQAYNGITVSCWVYDCAIEPATGYPVIVVATMPGGETPTPNNGSDHRYHYLRWDGAAWNDTEICAAGTNIWGGADPQEIYYSGGVCLDHSDPSIVYASRQVGSAWEMFRYVTADHGATFDSGTALTTGSGAGVKHLRPGSVYGHAPELQVVWEFGRFDSYLDYALGTMGAGS